MKMRAMWRLGRAGEHARRRGQQWECLKIYFRSKWFEAMCRGRAGGAGKQERRLGGEQRRSRRGKRAVGGD